MIQTMKFWGNRWLENLSDDYDETEERNSEVIDRPPKTINDSIVTLRIYE